MPQLMTFRPSSDRGRTPFSDQFGAPSTGCRRCTVLLRPEVRRYVRKPSGVRAPRAETVLQPCTQKRGGWEGGDGVWEPLRGRSQGGGAPGWPGRMWHGVSQAYDARPEQGPPSGGALLSYKPPYETAREPL